MALCSQLLSWLLHRLSSLEQLSQQLPYPQPVTGSTRSGATSASGPRRRSVTETRVRNFKSVLDDDLVPGEDEVEIERARRALVRALTTESPLDGEQRVEQSRAAEFVSPTATAFR